MLFHLTMEVHISPDLDEAVVAELRAAERERVLELQADGRWLHLWRVVGRNANVSILDVDSHAELHELLTSLPLWPYLDITVTPLTAHPSALRGA
jgi:muconolactone D-isomerase